MTVRKADDDFDLAVNIVKLDMIETKYSYLDV